MNKRIRDRRATHSTRLITALSADALAIKRHQLENLGYEKTSDVGISQVTSEFYQWFEKETGKELIEGTAGEKT